MTNWVRIFEALLPAPTEHLRSLYDYHGDLESAREALHQIREARLRRELPASGEVRLGRRRPESAS